MRFARSGFEFIEKNRREVEYVWNENFLSNFQLITELRNPINS